MVVRTQLKHLTPRSVCSVIDLEQYSLKEVLRRYRFTPQGIFLLVDLFEPDLQDENFCHIWTKAMIFVREEEEFDRML